MNVRAAQELLHELGSSLETLETKQEALLQFLKDKGMVSDDQLRPYLDRAGNASDVRWRAVRVRLEHLLSAENKEEQTFAEKERAQNPSAQWPVKEQKAEARNEGGDEKRQPASEAAMEDTTQNSQTKSDSERDGKDVGSEKSPGSKQDRNAA